MNKKEIKEALGEIAAGLANGDYCRGCWKFYFCAQVPTSKAIFNPCNGFIRLQKRVIMLSNEVAKTIKKHTKMKGAKVR